MKLYVVSTKYQPLVEFSLNSLSRKPVHKIAISHDDLRATFNASKNNALIACEKKEDAQTILALLAKGHNTTPDYIEKGIVLFDSPVIYAVDIDESKLPESTILAAHDLVGYADTKTIPLYVEEYDVHYADGNVRTLPLTGHDTELKLHTSKISELQAPVNIRKLNGLKVENVLKAFYVNAEANNLVSVNLANELSMKIISGFITVLGVAAVALAFTALGAGTGAFAGVAVAGSAVAMLGCGLFKFSNYHHNIGRALPRSKDPVIADGHDLDVLRPAYN